jgi:Flp pilus assembly protein TadD
MPRLDLAVVLLIAALTAIFVVGVARTTDPALEDGVLHPSDTRQGHVGALSFAESEDLLTSLRRQRAAESNPDRRAVTSAQLADVLARKHQHAQALVELGEALRLFPERPELLARAALIHFALGDRARAQAALQAARARAPDLPVVRSAAATIEGQAAPAP